MEKKKIYFERGEIVLNDTSRKKLYDIVIDLERMMAVSKRLKNNMRILLMGYTDATGVTSGINKKISKGRAEAVKELMVKQGLPGGLIRTEGKGVFPGGEKDLESQKQRIVKIRIITESKDD